VAGAADYLAKPIDVHSLLETVRQQRAGARHAKQRSNIGSMFI
jgi:FixJ family two-component response regulator